MGTGQVENTVSYVGFGTVRVQTGACPCGPLSLRGVKLQLHAYLQLHLPTDSDSDSDQRMAGAKCLAPASWEVMKCMSDFELFLGSGGTANQ